MTVNANRCEHLDDRGRRCVYDANHPEHWSHWHAPVQEAP